MPIKLTLELVPESSWFNNVRDFVSARDWGKLKEITFSKAGSKCEICGSIGYKWPVECHEIWSYDDETKFQILKGLIALCPDCHRVKHMGRANVTGKGEIAMEHLGKVNQWSYAETEHYIDQQFDVWERRSQHMWGLNLDWLDDYDVTLIMPEGVYKVG